MKSFFLLLFLFIISCSKNGFRNNLTNAINGYNANQIDIATLTPFDWDTLKILGPYFNAEGILPDLNTKLQKRIKYDDGISLLVFENNNKIIFTHILKRNLGDFSYKYNYQKIAHKDAKFLILKDAHDWKCLVKLTFNTVQCGYCVLDNDSNIAEMQPRGNCAFIENGKIIVCDSTLLKLPFNNRGLSTVLTKPYGWLFVKRDGSTIQTITIDNGPDILSEGLYRYIEDFKIGFINDSGKVMIKAAYSFAFPFNGDISIVCNECKKESDGEHSFMKGGSWGCIDKNGKILLPVQYSDNEINDKVKNLKNAFRNSN